MRDEFDYENYKDQRAYYRCKRLALLQEYFEDNAQPDSLKQINLSTIQAYFRRNTYFQNRDGNGVVSRNTLLSDIKLLEAVYGMKVIYDQSKRSFTIDEPPSTSEDALFQEIDTAIKKRHQISFSYFHYTLNTNMKEERNYSREHALFRVSPYLLYTQNNHTYLKAYIEESSSFRTFRLDRIDTHSFKRNSHTPCAGREAWEKERINEEKVKVFDSYHGTAKWVTLHCSNSLIQYVIEAFEKQNLHPEPHEDGKHFTVRVNVEVSPPFYAWVSTFRGRITITHPMDVVEGMEKFLLSSLRKLKQTQKGL